MLPMQAAVHMMQNPDPIKYLEDTEKMQCDPEFKDFLKLCFHKNANLRASAKDLSTHALFVKSK